MKTNLVRIMLRVTPEESQSFAEAALRDDRELHHWILRTLRTASGGVSSLSPLLKAPPGVLCPSSPLSQAVLPAATAAPPHVPETPEAFFARLTPEQKAKRAAHGLPTEYSPPENAPDQSYDCPPVETMEEYQEKLRKGEIKLDEPPAEESDYLKMLRAQGQIDTN